MKRILLFVTAALLPLTFTARADDAAELAKAQERLKNALKENQSLKGQMSVLQFSQQELTAKNGALEKSVKDQAKVLEEKTKEMSEYKQTAESKQMEQQAKIVSLEAEVKRFQAALDKWQAANIKVTDIAKKKEVERAKLSAKSADLERAVSDLRAKNTELFKLAGEILTRYEQFGLGKALAAREPFTGNAKVKLQNIVQDYNDKLLNQTAAAPPATPRP